MVYEIKLFAVEGRKTSLSGILMEGSNDVGVEVGYCTLVCRAMLPEGYWVKRFTTVYLC